MQVNGLPRVEFGIGIEPTDTAERTIEIAKIIEALGYSFVGVCDERLGGQRDAYVTLAACALNTEKITLGPHISDPYSRHPAMLAQAAASLDELAKGRVIISLGAGGSGFSEIGLERKRPAQTLKEAVQIIKALLKTGTCNFEGTVFKVRNARLGLKTREIPIYVSSRSPKILQAAGEVADGVVIGTYAAKDSIRYAITNINEGAKRAGRAIEDLDLVSWVYMSVSRNREAALENVRPFVASAIYRTSPEAYEHSGISDELAKRIANVFETERDLYTTGALRAGKLLPHDLVSDFSIAGTPGECVDKLRQIQSLGINKVWMMPFSFPGAHYVKPETYEVLNPFAKEVMNHFS